MQLTLNATLVQDDGVTTTSEVSLNSDDTQLFADWWIQSAVQYSDITAEMMLKAFYDRVQETVHVSMVGYMEEQILNMDSVNLNRAYRAMQPVIAGMAPAEEEESEGEPTE